MKIEETDEDKSSFAQDHPEETTTESTGPAKDLSMFERNLRLPDEGTECIDSNLQATKYVMIYLMRRMQRGLSTWTTHNIKADRKAKLENRAKGFRPEFAGGTFQRRRLAS